MRMGIYRGAYLDTWLSQMGHYLDPTLSQIETGRSARLTNRPVLAQTRTLINEQSTLILYKV